MYRATPLDTDLCFYSSFSRNLPKHGVDLSHAHEEHEIFLVARGSARYAFANNMEITVNPGQVLAVPAGVGHFMIECNDADYHGLHIHPALFKQVMEQSSAVPDTLWQWYTSIDHGQQEQQPVQDLANPTPTLTARTVYDPEIYSWLLELFEQVQAEHARCSFYYSAFLSNVGRLIAIGFARIMEMPPMVLPDNAEMKQVATIKGWIDRHYLHPVNTGDLAEMANLSRYRFTTIFEKITGMTPKDYVLQKRLHHAANFLADSAISINDVAQMSGFMYVTNFVRTFKAHFGTTPGLYRTQRQRQAITEQYASSMENEEPIGTD